MTTWSSSLTGKVQHSMDIFKQLESWMEGTIFAIRIETTR